jgi:predicted cation transporter
MFLFLIEGFGPKAVVNCVNVTASNICEKVKTVSRQVYHRSGYQSLHLLSYIRSLRIFTFLYSLQYAAYNFTPSNSVRPAYS